MNFKKISRLWPHPRRDESRGYALPYDWIIFLTRMIGGGRDKRALRSVTVSEYCCNEQNYVLLRYQVEVYQDD